MTVNWPATWVGTWVAPDGKTVVVSNDGDGLRVTVRPDPDAEPYLSNPLLGGQTKPIDRLPAVVHVDPEGRRCLEIEAGTPELGPTYRLYPAIEEAGERMLATDDAPVQRIVLLPNTSIGLYDDWEDDHGVTWAYPLLPLRRR